MKRNKRSSQLAKILKPYLSPNSDTAANSNKALGQHTHPQYLTTAQGDSRYIRKGEDQEPAEHEHDYEPALGNPASDGYVLSSTAAGVRSWIASVARTVANTWTAVQTFSAGIVTAVIKPASDSTAAVQIQTTGGTDVINVDTSNGRVGVGDVTPATTLHINKNFSAAPTGLNAIRDLLLITRQNGPVAAALNADAAQIASLFFGDSANIDAGHVAYNNSTGILELAAENGINFAVDSVGVGTSSPVAKLHVSLSYTTAITGFNALQHLLLITRQNSIAKMAINSGTGQVAGIELGDSGNVAAAYFRHDNSTGVTSIGSEGTIQLDDIVNFAATMGNSTKSPTTDAPTDWVEIKIGGTTYYLPAYTAA